MRFKRLIPPTLRFGRGCREADVEWTVPPRQAGYRFPAMTPWLSSQVLFLSLKTPMSVVMNDEIKRWTALRRSAFLQWVVEMDEAGRTLLGRRRCLAVMLGSETFISRSWP